MLETLRRSSDFGISTLPAVLHVPELQRELRTISLAPWQGELQEVRVRVLQCHIGKRCTVEISLRAAYQWHDLIGKVYATDRSDVYEAMQKILSAGFGPDEELSIPQPLVFVPKLNLLLQEKVEGASASAIFLKGSEAECLAAGQRCARWLAKFQSVAPRIGPVFELNKHFVCLERWSRRIAELGEPLAGKVSRLLGRLESAAAALSQLEMCAGHGSYSSAHVIPTERRTTTFDWDGYDVADPSRDVARFLVALQRLAFARLGSIRALDRVAEVFWETYGASNRSRIEQNLSFYMAATCLQLAKYNISHPVRHWREKIDSMLDHGLRILKQDGANKSNGSSVSRYW